MRKVPEDVNEAIRRSCVKQLGGRLCEATLRFTARGRENVNILDFKDEEELSCFSVQL